MKRKRRFQNPWGKGGEYYNQSAVGGSQQNVEPSTSLVSETGEGFYPGQTPTETPSSTTDSINTGRLLQYEEDEAETCNPWAEDGEYYPDNVLDSKDPNDKKSVLYKGNPLDSKNHSDKKSVLYNGLEKETPSYEKRTDIKYLSYPIDYTVASDVQSIVIATLYNQVREEFKFIIKKRKILYLNLPDAIDKIGADANEKTALNSISNRWKMLENIENTVNPIDLETLPFTEKECQEKVQQDIADLQNLQDKKFKNISSDIKELHKALSNYFKTLKIISEEKIEKKRFDAYFESAKANKLLSAIPNVTFNGADIKAMLMQETADFTNVDIAGLEDKEKGYISHHINNIVVGICQMKQGAKKEALEWARKKGVDISSDPDPRTIPELGILLAIAYLGRTVELVYPSIPIKIPSNDEVKKICWAAYNMGPIAMRDKLTDFYKKKNNSNYSFSDITISEKISEEPVNYVIGIIRRLSKNGLM
jgi:hypothetical protein